MRYTVHSDSDLKKIYNEIGIKDYSELFSSIPKKILNPIINLPDPLSEKEIKEKIVNIGYKNKNLNNFLSFLGAGAYNHYIPSAVKAITTISSFYTAYTPYQAEISQGTLQYMFEFQTLICRLTGMEVANASMYDGATALAEAILMANRINGKNKVYVSKTIHPEYINNCKTYCMGKDIKIAEIDYTNGITDIDLISRCIDKNTSAVVIQNPNFFGCFEDVYKIKEIIEKYPDCIYIIAIVNPMSLGLCNSPSCYGADVVVGEAQSFGNSLSFGGPYLGFFATKQKYLRQIPGRIVGKTIDSKRNDAFVLTFQTREQHIRKSKATSNICSNHSLNALAATVYLSIVGEYGLKSIANLCLQRSHYLSQKISSIKNFKLKFSSNFFNEFAVHTDLDLNRLFSHLYKRNILGGIKLNKFFPELKGCFLVTATEANSEEDINKYIVALDNIVREVS